MPRDARGNPTFIEKLTAVKKAVEDLLAQLQASQHDKFGICP